MNDKPISATFIFVDRRRTGRGKSLPNRQKLLDRIKDSIRNSKPEDIDAGGVQKSASGGSGNNQANPVKVTREALSEPTYRYASKTGEVEVVLPGNDRWLKGDEFPMDEDEDGDGQGSGAGHGPDGEDDFIVNISRNEFYNVFFEDCELPDLKETHEKELPEAVMRPAGFQKDGNPGQLSVIRSFKNSLGRRKALNAEAFEELAELEEELQRLYDDLAAGDMNPGPTAACRERIEKVQARIDELRVKIGATPFFEKLDLRYRKTERVMVKQADAVLIMAMDISGSMMEEHKRIARKFFAMQYAFIQRKYPNTDLVFIYHTDEAEEVTEEDFFTTRKNGGTTISSAIKKAHQIVKERYDPDQTNIYFSYAGDGDNWMEDNKLVLNEFEDQGFMAKLRHAVYAQVGPPMGYSMGGVDAFWNIMKSIASTTKKLHMIKIEAEDKVFTAFKSIYKKKGSK